MAAVIEFAEKRIEEEAKANCDGADNSHVISYWVAYLDGAKAQLKESEKFKSKAGDIVSTIECKTIAFIQSVSAFAHDMDGLFTEYLKAQAEVDSLYAEKKANEEV